MSTRRRVLCKFFANGSCLKGEFCDFSHDWSDQSKNICAFYQKGRCIYGSRCRYDHVKVHCNQRSARSSSGLNLAPHVATTSLLVIDPSELPLNEGHSQPSSSTYDLSALDQSSTSLPGLTQRLEASICQNVDSNSGSANVQLFNLPLCSFAADSCPQGERCPHIHGDVCSICKKNYLHPYCTEEIEEHMKMCQKNKKDQETLKYSNEIECSICLELVHSKPTAAERKFGLLLGCDHPFCISCIRKWRHSSPDSGMDLNTTLRACPVCRKLSYFVVPSVTWYSTKEEKQEIIDSYKAKLKSIDCKYFEFGLGSCPFGASCFYKHTFKPHANRKGNRSQRYRPHASRSMQPTVEREPENLFNRLLVEDELTNLAEHLFLGCDDPDYFDYDDFTVEDFDAEDADSFLAMSFLLSEFGDDYDDGDGDVDDDGDDDVDDDGDNDDDDVDVDNYDDVEDE